MGPQTATLRRTSLETWSGNAPPRWPFSCRSSLPLEQVDLLVSWGSLMVRWCEVWLACHRAPLLLMELGLVRSESAVVLQDASVDII